MKFTRKEIFLLSLIIVGIILAVSVFFIIFYPIVPTNWLWLVYVIIFGFFIIILIASYLSIRIFLKRIRIMKKLDHLKSIFLASVSHELRTPLASIIGFTDMILKGWTGDINEEQEKQLKIIMKSAKNLLNLINDLIDVNKITANELDIRKDNFNLVEELAHLIETFINALDKKGLDFHTDTPENLMIFSDKQRINQILGNLIRNAIKFTDKGKISIQVLKTNGNAEISIKDTGPGIKDEDLDKLFKPFSRIIEPGKFKRGTGLGLYLSKKLANLLGGEIFVESEFGKGSTFTLSLKLKEGEILI